MLGNLESRAPHQGRHAGIDLLHWTSEDSRRCSILRRRLLTRRPKPFAIARTVRTRCLSTQESGRPFRRCCSNTPVRRRFPSTEMAAPRARRFYSNMHPDWRNLIDYIFRRRQWVQPPAALTGIRARESQCGHGAGRSATGGGGFRLQLPTPTAKAISAPGSRVSIASAQSQVASQETCDRSTVGPTQCCELEPHALVGRMGCDLAG